MAACLATFGRRYDQMFTIFIKFTTFLKIVRFTASSGDEGPNVDHIDQWTVFFLSQIRNNFSRTERTVVFCSTFIY